MRKKIVSLFIFSIMAVSTVGGFTEKASNMNYAGSEKLITISYSYTAEQTAATDKSIDPPPRG